jgi:fatty-acyl-CoA synthase
VEYLEVQLAAARLGAVVACLNWRLSAGELTHCVSLVDPSLIIASERFADRVSGALLESRSKLVFGSNFDDKRDAAVVVEQFAAIDASAPLLILYTSGTTGLPKGAAISRAAMTARCQHFSGEFGFTSSDAYIAWSPMFHMGGTDYSLATLVMGGKVLIEDGFNVDRICQLLELESIGWLLTMPGMTEELIATMKSSSTSVRSVGLVGCMADLIPGRVIAELTRLVGAPFLNTFGSTETGLPPASAGKLKIGRAPDSLAKVRSGQCLVRLVDHEGNDVPKGAPGEVIVRTPTLFSGYWNDEEATAEAFRDGWFHMGDVMVEQPDGALDYVDRVKYLIKSGGENIYPAEIERALRAHPDVLEVAVVRKPDPRWGEVPVAFVSTILPDDDSEKYVVWCEGRMARYKVPRDIRFLAEGNFPRSATGKIQRQELERRWIDPTTASQPVQTS